MIAVTATSTCHDCCAYHYFFVIAKYYSAEHYSANYTNFPFSQLFLCLKLVGPGAQEACVNNKTALAAFPYPFPWLQGPGGQISRNPEK